MEDHVEASADSQYLTFDAAGERYAIAVMKLREILPFEGATRVPMAPSCIRGLINLRGNAISVLDLSAKFGTGSAPATKRSCVVIVDPPADVDGDERRVMGILADSVNSVVELQADELEEVPSFGTTAPGEYLDGLARIDDEFIPIINVDRILSEESLFADSTAAPGDGPDSAVTPSADADPTAESAGEPAEDRRRTAGEEQRDVPGPDES